MQEQLLNWVKLSFLRPLIRGPIFPSMPREIGFSKRTPTPRATDVNCLQPVIGQLLITLDAHAYLW